MKIYKAFKKVFFGALWIFVVLLVAGSIALYFYKDRIIDHVISQANEYISTPIEVSEIDLNTWDKFPNVSMTFHDVYIQESWARSTDPLLQAERVYVLLNPFHLIMGKLEVNQVHISNASVFIKTNMEGIPNYRILNKRSDAGEDSLQIDLKKVKLENTEVTYLDYKRNQEHIFFTSHQEARLNITGKLIDIEATGDIAIKTIKVKGKEYVADKLIENTARLQINQEINTISIHPSELTWNGSLLQTSGEIIWGSENNISLSIEGINSNIQTILSLIPGRISHS